MINIFLFVAIMKYVFHFSRTSLLKWWSMTVENVSVERKVSKIIFVWVSIINLL